MTIWGNWKSGERSIGESENRGFKVLPPRLRGATRGLGSSPPSGPAEYLARAQPLTASR
jgi:hypothetical protein